jgi:hypothetical protein
MNYETIVASALQDFSVVTALTDGYAPACSVWVGDYPYVQKGRFLRLRGRGGWDSGNEENEAQQDDGKEVYCSFRVSRFSVLKWWQLRAPCVSAMCVCDVLCVEDRGSSSHEAAYEDGARAGRAGRSDQPTDEDSTAVEADGECGGQDRDGNEGIGGEGVGSDGERGAGGGKMKSHASGGQVKTRPRRKRRQ